MAWHHGYTWWMPAHQGAAEHRTLASEQLKCPFAAPITLPAQARIGALWHVTVAADRVSFTVCRCGVCVVEAILFSALARVLAYHPSSSAAITAGCSIEGQMSFTCTLRVSFPSLNVMCHVGSVVRLTNHASENTAAPQKRFASPLRCSTCGATPLDLSRYDVVLKSLQSSHPE